MRRLAALVLLVALVLLGGGVSSHAQAICNGDGSSLSIDHRQTPNDPTTTTVTLLSLQGSRLQSIQFADTAEADRVSFGSLTWPRSGGTYTFTTTPEQVRFTLRRVSSLNHRLVTIYVTDSCGTWTNDLQTGPVAYGAAPIAPTATPTGAIPPTSTSTPTPTSTATPTNTPVGTATPTPTGTVTPTPTTVTQSFTNITTNLASYPGGVPRYEMVEVTFDAGTNATNRFLPHMAVPVAGVVHTGVTVDGEFSQDGFSTVYRQPAFYGPLMETELSGGAVPVKGGLDWIYPAGVEKWRVRFAPNAVGAWQFRLRMQDGSGTNTSQAFSFTAVTNPANRGFLRVSPADFRYFEYQDGTYFPALGHNTTSSLTAINPSSNAPLVTAWGNNGIRLLRFWISTWGAFGSSWSQWTNSSDLATANEPQQGIHPPTTGGLALYAGLTAPSIPDGGDLFVWLNGDEQVFQPAGIQFRYEPCRILGHENAPVPLKRDTYYRLRVRYQEHLLEGPRVAGQGFGFAVKTFTAAQGSLLWGATDATRCNYPGNGTTLANTFGTGTTPVDTSHPTWRQLTNIVNSGSLDHYRYLALTLENTKSSDGQLADSGHVFIHTAELREVIGSVAGEDTGNYGPNVLDRGDSNPHMSVAPARAYGVDLLLAQARAAGVHLRVNLNEKNDQAFWWLNTDGSLGTGVNGDFALFYGDGANLTQSRLYQQAWWRYAQGRWGWSTTLHSWELLNEGPNSAAHRTLADEFAKYMKCGVFGLSYPCAAQPNAHLITTSLDQPTSAVGSSSAFYGPLTTIDYESINRYVCRTTDTGCNPSFVRSDANWSDPAVEVASVQAAYGQGAVGWRNRPVQRAEVGWTFPVGQLDVVGQGQDAGNLLHAYIWSMLDRGGVSDQYWGNPPWYRHVAVLSGATTWDYRDEYANLAAFLANVPLSNGRYVDAAPTISASHVSAVGQKDVSTSVKRAHVWVRNENHTWCSYVASLGTTVAGCTATWDSSSLTGTVTLTGFANSTAYDVQLWQFARDTTLTSPTTVSVTSDGSGNLVLNLSTLLDTATADAAIKVGAY